MRLASALVAPFVVLAACGEDSSSSTKPLVLPTTGAVTDVGTPAGDPVEGTIGPSGGSLSSADGKLEIMVPPGALASDTAISITPITATAPGAVAAWRLGPEGTTFAAPVTLRFAAGDADLVGSEPGALRIATQRPDRTWGVPKDATVAGTSITVPTTHFSDWSALLGWQLRPGSAKIKTGQTQKLDVRYCHFVEREEQELVGVVAECQEQDLQPITGPWAVNGVTGGNADTGTLSFDGESATYTAPNAVPSSNPVAVSVELSPPKRGKTLLVSNIEVTGAAGYSGTFAFSTKQSSFELEGTAGTVEWAVDYESAERNEYKPSGSVHLKFTSTDPKCAPVEGTYPIEDGHLTVHTASSPVYASTYFFNIQLVPKVTLSCTGADDQPFTVPDFQIPAILQAGFCDGATPVPYADASNLTGEGPCSAHQTVSSSWSFTK